MKIFYALILILVITFNFANAEVNKVKFPENIGQLVHYATVKRGEVTEHLLTTPEAMKAVKEKRKIPNGTHFVLVDYRGGKVFRYFIMQKGENWGKDYDERYRNGDWQYQWFMQDKTVNMKENTTRCMSCHQPQESSDYLYTGYRIPRFNGTPIE